MPFCFAKPADRQLQGAVPGFVTRVSLTCLKWSKSSISAVMGNWCCDACARRLLLGR